MKGVRRSRLGGDAIGTMAEPGAGEPHQLLTTNSNSCQHGRDLDVLNQQAVQQSQDQDAEDSQAELEQAQLKCQTQGTAVHQGRPELAELCRFRFKNRLSGHPSANLMSRKRASIEASSCTANIGVS